ncbi:MAG TPA: LacI family transcriptional regulator [Firmicutes bacterium]|nr:LacI family transcriptional regulator [Bacillota bacterium]
MSDKLNLHTIARAVGVSHMTVSRVLNNDKGVAPQTGKRVLKMVKDLGYEPNLLARGLRSGCSYLVGINVNSLINPYYGYLIHALQMKLNANRWVPIVLNDDLSPDNQLENLRSFRRLTVDGIIVVNLSSRPAVLELLEAVREQGKAVVVISETKVDAPFTTVLLDVESAYREATEHLIALGHRRIGFLSPMAREATKLSARYQGWWKALTEAGIEPADELIQHVPRPEDCGQALDGYWRLAEPPTALLAHNDMYGAYAIYALQGAGKRVPDDVSVFGFEHLPGQVPVSPALTTARIPIAAIGRSAAELCLAMMRGEDIPEEVPVFQAELVFRESTGPKLAGA